MEHIGDAALFPRAVVTTMCCVRAVCFPGRKTRTLTACKASVLIG